MGIAYDEEKVRQHLIDAGVWPAGDADEPGVTDARDWWVRLIKQVTYGVNDHPWDETEFIGDAVNEISGNAVDELVGEARKARMMMRLCELSDLTEFEYEEEIELRLTSVVTSSLTGVHKRTGESEAEYVERLERERRKHTERIAELLELKSVVGIYLESAASLVAQRWCQALAEEVVSQLEEAEDCAVVVEDDQSVEIIAYGDEVHMYEPGADSAEIVYMAAVGSNLDVTRAVVTGKQWREKILPALGSAEVEVEVHDHR